MKQENKPAPKLVIFYGLDDPIQHGFINLIHDQIDCLADDSYIASDIRISLAKLGLARKFDKLTLDDLSIGLKSKGDLNQISWLLLFALEQNAQAPSRKMDKYLSLVRSVIFSCLISKSYHPNPELVHQSTVSEACRGLRLLLGRNSDFLDHLKDVNDYPSNNIKILQGLYDSEQADPYINKDHLEAIIKIFTYYLEDTSPIYRDRNSGIKEAGCQTAPPAFSLEGEDVEISQLRLKMPAAKIFPDEFAADQALVETWFHDHTFEHDDPIEDIEDLQIPVNRGYCDAISKRGYYTSCSPNRLSPYQAKIFYENCLIQTKEDPTRKYHYLYLALSLILSRTIDHLLSIRRRGYDGTDPNEYWHIKDGQWYLAYRPNIPHKEAPNLGEDIQKARKGLFYKHTRSGFIYTPIPIELNELLSESQFEQRFNLDGLPDAFTKACDNINQPINKEMLPPFIKFSLKSKGVDKQYRSLICGELSMQNSAVYYCSASVETTVQHYYSILSELGIPEQSTFTPDHLGLGDNPYEYIGSCASPKDKHITTYFNDQREFLIKDMDNLHAIEDWIDHHNEMLLYTLNVANLGTGHRASITPFSQSTDLDLAAKFVFIKDKIVNDSRHGRLVPLCKTVIDQFKTYDEHLIKFQAFLKLNGFGNSLAPQIRRCLDPNEADFPYLFLLPELKDNELFDEMKHTIIICPSPKMIAERTFKEWPVKTNWYRHYLRTALTEIARTNGLLTGELIDAIMGHGQAGAYAESPLAGFQSHALLHTHSILQKMMGNLDIKPVKSFP